MSLEVDFLPCAVAVGNNADSQANFQGSGYQLNGFVNGVAQPFQANKLWRQSSMIGAAVANFIANILNINILDDGNIANLIANLTSAVKTAAMQAVNSGVSVAFSATPVFDAIQGNKFQIVLTGNVTSSTLVNVQPWQRLTFIVKQDATGGRTFAGPANLPITPIANGASQVSVQSFIADNAGNVYPDTAMTVS